MFLDKSLKMKAVRRILPNLAFLVFIVFLTACNSRSQSLPDYEKDTLPDNLIPPEPGPAFVIVEDARSDGDHAEWMSLFISGGVWADQLLWPAFPSAPQPPNPSVADKSAVRIASNAATTAGTSASHCSALTLSSGIP